MIGFHEARVFDEPRVFVTSPVGSTGGVSFEAPALKPALWFDGWWVAPRTFLTTALNDR